MNKKKGISKNQEKRRSREENQNVIDEVTLANTGL